MSRSLFVPVAGALALAVAPLASGEFLLVPDSSSDTVLLLDAFDGSVVNSSFLDVATQAANAGVSSTPIEALPVGNEIWVSDQVADRIWRFDQSGGFLGDIGAGMLDNIRGMEVVGNTVYVAQAGTGAFNEGIVTIDVNTQQLTGSFSGFPAADTSYWDVLSYNGELLVSNSDSGNDGIERYGTDGSFLGFFATSDGVSDFDFVQQLAPRSNGNLMAAGFSSPAGVYEFQPDGTPNGIIAGADFGPRGVFELGNGEILWTNGTWIRTDDNILLEGGSYRFINGFIPAPGVMSLMLIGGVAARRRRRV